MLNTAGKMEILLTTGTPPTPRNSLSIASLHDNIYVFGGIREDFNTKTDEFYNDLYHLDTQKKVWTKLSPSGTGPSPRGTAGAIALPSTKEILVFGGTFYEKGYANMRMFNELWSYSIADNKWTERHPAANAPAARAKPLVWEIDEKLYVFGGITAKYQILNDLWCYDPITHVWQEIIAANKAPPGRLEARGGHKNNLLIMYAGESMDPQQKGFKMLDDIWQYDIKNNVWTNLTPSHSNIPIHNYACSGMIDDYFYIVGGDIKGVQGATMGFGAPFPQNVCNEIWRFNLSTHTWEEVAATGEKAPAVKQAGTAMINNKMYIIGGFDFINKDDKGPGQVWNEKTYIYHL